MKFANIHFTTHVVTYTISFFITTIPNVDLDEQQQQMNYIFNIKVVTDSKRQSVCLKST